MIRKTKTSRAKTKVLLSAMIAIGLIAGTGGITPVSAAVNTEYDLIDFVKSPALIDHDFEVGGSAWSVRNKGVIADGVSYGTGTKSGMVPSGNSNSFIGQNINVDANTDYTLTAQIKVSIADAHVFFGARTGGDGSQPNIKDVKVAPGNTDWTEVTFDFNSGSNTQVLIQLVKWGDGSDANLSSITNCNGYIDNVKIEKKGATSDNDKYEMIWADDFNGTELNENNWGYELGSIRGVEQQHYVKSEKNTFMRNGQLVLKATDRAVEDQYKNPRGNRQVIYDSGSIRTHGKQEFLYGRIEMKAKLPKGKGVFPAFWTLGSNFTLDGDINGKQGNPWSRCGEIDIMELTGKDLGNVGNKQAWGTPHFYYPGGDSDKDTTGSGGKAYTISEDYNNDYHVFGVNWSPDKIEWYVDGVIYNTLDFSNPTWGKYAKMAYSQPQYIQFNLAMGGNWPGDAGTNLAGTEFEIDYVYYAQNDEQKAAAKEYYDAAPNISGLKNVTMMQGDIPDLLDGITSDKNTFVDFSIDNEYMFKNEGGLTNADKVCDGKDDADKLAKLPVGKYNIHYTAIPNDVEYESNNVPNREKEYKMTRRTLLLTVEERVFPKDVILEGVYGEKLSSVTLPENWTWDKPDTILSNNDAKYTVKYSHNGVEASEEVSVNLVATDKTTLKDKLADAKTYLDKDIYTSETIAILQAKIIAAQVVLDKTNATKAEVTAAINNLNDAIAGLVKKPVTPPSEDDVYDIVEDKQQTVEQGKSITFKSNASIEKFKEVLIDGKVLDKAYYTVKEGSTIITLNAEYTRLLSSGEHTITIVSTDGKATTKFAIKKTVTIEKPEDKPTGPELSPETGDNTSIALFASLATIAFTGIWVLFKREENEA